MTRSLCAVTLGAVLLLGASTVVHAQGDVYVTEVSEYEDDVLVLANGARFEQEGAETVGLMVEGDEVVLYDAPRGMKLWVEGEPLVQGELVQRPDAEPNRRGRWVFVMEVHDGGRLLELDSGDVLEVIEADRFIAELWVGPFDAVLLEDGRLLNLADPVSGMVWTTGAP